MLIICLFSSPNRWVGQDARGSKSARQVLEAIVNCATTVLWVGAMELEARLESQPVAQPGSNGSGSGTVVCSATRQWTYRQAMVA